MSWSDILSSSSAVAAITLSENVSTRCINILLGTSPFSPINSVVSFPYWSVNSELCVSYWVVSAPTQTGQILHRHRTLCLNELWSLQGVSFPSPSTLCNAQHEEDWGHEERRHLLRWVPQSLHPIAAAIAHPRSGAGVRNKHHMTM